MKEQNKAKKKAAAARKLAKDIKPRKCVPVGGIFKSKLINRWLNRWTVKHIVPSDA